MNDPRAFALYSVLSLNALEPWCREEWRRQIALRVIVDI